jgi:hypothetical protein
MSQESPIKKGLEASMGRVDDDYDYVRNYDASFCPEGLAGDVVGDLVHSSAESLHG